MEFVRERAQVQANIETLREYGRSGSAKEFDFHVNLLKAGRRYVAWQDGGETAFAPSRFVGYRGNTMSRHLSNPTKAGGQTNLALVRLFRDKPTADAELDKELTRQLQNLDAKPYKWERTFWKL